MTRHIVHESCAKSGEGNEQKSNKEACRHIDCRGRGTETLRDCFQTLFFFDFSICYPVADLLLSHFSLPVAISTGVQYLNTRQRHPHPHPSWIQNLRQRTTRVLVTMAAILQYPQTSTTSTSPCSKPPKPPAGPLRPASSGSSSPS